MSNSTCSRSSSGMSCNGSIERSKASVRRNTSGRSSSGMPMMSAITCIGIRYATSATKSSSPTRPPRRGPDRCGPRSLLELGDHPRREPGADQSPHPRMLRPFLGDEHHPASFLLEQDDHGAVEGGEGLPVTVGLLHLPMTEDRPEADVGVERRDVGFEYHQAAGGRAPRRTARTAYRCGRATGRAD